MGSLWEGIKLGIRTLIKNPIGYLTDPVKATSDLYRTELVETGLDPVEVESRLKTFHDSGGVLTDVGEAYGSVTSGLGKAVKSLGSLLNFAGKNLIFILIIGVGLYLLYIAVLRKGLKVT